MVTTKKRGRKPKSFKCPWDNKTIDGLYRRPDGRWRIVATGYEFREADERTAVARFQQWQRSQAALQVETATAQIPFDLKTIARIATMSNAAGIHVKATLTDDAEAMVVSQPVIPDVVWGYLRTLFLTNAAFVAEKVGLPQLASYRSMALPQDSIRLTTLITAYEQHASSSDIAKRKARAAWDEMVEMTTAKTLADLTTDVLLRYADGVKRLGLAAETVDNRFTKIKTIIGFGLKRAMDESQITSALNRCKLLVPPKQGKKTFNPTPIKRADFAKLLKKADDLMAAALLLSMNACLYVSEAMSVDWDELDLERGTYLSSRSKTGVIRSAALWPQTVAALKKLKRTPGAVFKSQRGDRYHPNSFRKVFAALRTDAKVSDTVEYNMIRDGAYTAATEAGVEFQLVQILAGHRTPGEADHYIARNPKMVAPVCKAVEKHYFGLRLAGKAA